MAVANNADDYANARIGIFFTGSSVGNLEADGDLTGQCTMVGKWYFKDMTTIPNPFAARGNAKSVGDTLVAQGHATEVAAVDRKRGDLVVWPNDGGNAGHEGVLLSGDLVLEENAGIKGTPSKVVNGVTVYASRKDPLYATWRVGTPKFYRLQGYAETSSAPASVPAAVHTPAHIGQLLSLPASIDSWNVYNVTGPWTAGHQVAVLDPAKYGGLSYEVLGNPAADVYIINTTNFGQVAIYVSASTPATFVDKATPASRYVRFAEPMNLQANKQPTDVYDLTGATWTALSSNIVKQLSKGDSFVAVGKYTHPLGGVYYMTDYSFGQADTTGSPAYPYGINTVDLSPAPETTANTQTSAPQQDTQVTASAPLVAVRDNTQPTEKPSSVATDDGSVAVPVTVIPTDPNKWQSSFKEQIADMVASQSVVIHDQAGSGSDLQLIRGQVVHVGGTFIKDAVVYYRTQKGVADGTWYGIPVKQNSLSTLVEDDSVFTIGEDVLHAIGKLSFRDKIIKVVASVIGFITRKKKA